MPSINYIKLIVFFICCLPFASFVYLALTNNLGPDPAEALADRSGEWTLRFLLLTLAVTPLRRWLKNVNVMRYRRMFGLFAFFYACLHLIIYLLFLLGLQWQLFYQDFFERPYITAGALALLALFPLALTSTSKWQRKLGSRWRKLHKLVYFAAAMALAHLWWQLRSDMSEALIYTACFCLLLALRWRG